MGPINRLLNCFSPGFFRMFLALVVLVNHSSRIDLGDWAVYSFFVLSGYWIYRMWIQKYSKTTAPIRVFWASRFLRILPVFWLANLLSFVIQHYVDPTFLSSVMPRWGWLSATASNTLIFGSANLPRSQRALDPAWSLDIEFQFYLAFPLVLYLLSQRKWGTLWGLLVGSLCVCGFVTYLSKPSPSTRDLSCYGLYFLIGIMSAHREWSPSARWAASAMCIFVMFVILCSIRPDLHFIIENTKHGATSNELHIKLVLQAILALLTAPLALATVRNRSNQVDRGISELTFVVYLMQWPVLNLHGHFFGNLPPLQRLPSVAVAWFAVGVVSILVFRFFDRPLEEIRKRWVSSLELA
jgi:peptidoglycan/LPS O-acetylase OafA/YrhL